MSSNPSSKETLCLLGCFELNEEMDCMHIDKNKVKTQDDLDEQAPIDQVEDRVEAKMKKIEGSAKRNVGEGLQNRKLAREGKRLEKEADGDLEKAK